MIMELQNKLLLFLGHVGGSSVSEVARIQVNSVQCTRLTLHSLEAACIVGRTIKFKYVAANYMYIR